MYFEDLKMNCLIKSQIMTIANWKKYKNNNNYLIFIRTNFFDNI